MADLTARRVVIRAPRDVDLEAFSLNPPGPGQALVRGDCSLISAGTEMTAYTGDFPGGASAWAAYVRYPFHPGYSLVGHVQAVGHGCALRVGQRVAVEAPHQSAVLVDAPADQAIGADAGRHAPSAVMPVPDGVACHDATFQTLARVVLNGVRMADARIGDCVVVLGCGLLGQLAVRFLRLSGAAPVVAVDLSDGRLERARAGGADVTLRAEDEDLAHALRAQTGGRLADSVIDVTGAPESFVTATRLVRDMGSIVLLGSPRGPVTIDLHDDVHSRGLRVLGAHASTTPRLQTGHTPWTMRRNAELFLSLLAQGRLSVSDLVSHRFALSDAAQAYALLDGSRSSTMGVALDLGAE